VEGLRRLAREGSMPQVVVLAADLAEDALLEAVSLGVRGVVPKGAAPGLVARCVRAVHGGGRWLDPGLVGRALDRFLAREAERQRAVGRR
jgi:DNA-binding NarL/FixJ family response regulator